MGVTQALSIRRQDNHKRLPWIRYTLIYKTFWLSLCSKDQCSQLEVVMYSFMYRTRICIRFFSSLNVKNSRAALIGSHVDTPQQRQSPSFGFHPRSIRRFVEVGDYRRLGSPSSFQNPLKADSK